MLLMVSAFALAGGTQEDNQTTGQTPDAESTGKTIDVSNLVAPTKAQTITILKKYAVSSTANYALPSDKLTFTPVDAIVEDGPAKTAPAVTIEVDDITGGNKLEYEARIKLPPYTQVGVYYYTFTESDGQIAGITYIKNTITLRVTVVQAENALKVEAVALREAGENGIKQATEGTASTKTEYDLSKKIDSFDNKYEAGSLTVEKLVTGNLGQLDKEWEFEVTFTSSKKVNAPITYLEKASDTTKKSIAAGWTDPQKVKIYLKSGEKVQFDNIPAGVTYSITETDANKDGYDTKADNASGTIAAADTAAAKFTNTKDVNIDTGVSLETSAYVLIMALALAGFVMMVIRRREEY